MAVNWIIVLSYHGECQLDFVVAGIKTRTKEEAEKMADRVDVEFTPP